MSIDESNHKIYFHSEKIGHKLDAIANSEKVSFCVCEKEYHKDGHWLLNIRSVIIFGRIRIVDDWSDDLSIKRDGYSLCLFFILCQLINPYISLNKNATKQTTTEIYRISEMLASIHKTMRTISFAA